jgi:MarR family 2-MHQ and catechol resistance regulon transcriptional repressor
MATKYKGKEKEMKALDAFIKLTRAGESVSARLHGRLSEYELTVSQFGALDALYHLGPLPQGELAKKILRSSGNLTMVVDNLEKRGLVKRERLEADRRSNTVRLTEKGKTLFKRILPGHVQAIVGEMGALTGNEQEQLGRLCRRLGLKKRE